MAKKTIWDKFIEAFLALDDSENTLTTLQDFELEQLVLRINKESRPGLEPLSQGEYDLCYIVLGRLVRYGSQEDREVCLQMRIELRDRRIE
jgi:hypothetical protein